MPHCVDASFVVNLLLPLPNSPLIEATWVNIIGDGSSLLAPPLLFAETTSVIRRHAHLRQISDGEASAAIGRLFRLSITAVHHPAVYLRALEMATQLGHGKAYDVQYMAVAEIEGAELVTCDRGMHVNGNSLGIRSRLLA